MKVWLTVKWIKDDANRWKVMTIHTGHLLPESTDESICKNYIAQLVEIPGEFRLFTPDEISLKEKLTNSLKIS